MSEERGSKPSEMQAAAASRAAASQRAMRSRNGSARRDCAEASRRSLACIEANYEDKERCRVLFEEYKKCKKAETEARKLANNGGKKPTFFPSF